MNNEAYHFTNAIDNSIVAWLGEAKQFKNHHDTEHTQQVLINNRARAALEPSCQVQPGHATPPLYFDDGKSVLCNFNQIIGDCVSLAYSPKLASERRGYTTSFDCCLRFAPWGEQKHGMDMPIKARMETKARDDNMTQADKHTNKHEIRTASK